MVGWVCAMPGLNQITVVMTAMQAALAARQWEALLSLDQQLASILQSQRWSRQEQGALQSVLQQHAHLRQACLQAEDELAGQLAGFSQQRTISLAYAAAGEFMEAE